VAADEVEPAVSPGLILAILVLTIFGCVGSTLVAQWLANSVNAGALSIATNAAPAIQDLSNARGELVRISIAGASALSTTQELNEFDAGTLAPERKAKGHAPYCGDLSRCG